MIGQVEQLDIRLVEDPQSEISLAAWKGDLDALQAVVADAESPDQSAESACRMMQQAEVVDAPDGGMEVDSSGANILQEWEEFWATIPEDVLAPLPPITEEDLIENAEFLEWLSS